MKNLTQKIEEAHQNSKVMVLQLFDNSEYHVVPIGMTQAIWKPKRKPETTLKFEYRTTLGHVTTLAVPARRVKNLRPITGEDLPF